MIRIDKPDRGPSILRDLNKRGPKKTQSLKDAYDAGDRDFEFASDVYGAKSVKNMLVKAQHGKCCFCESKIRHVSYGDVEHFRPKGGFVQRQGDELTQPGYFWLAYEWSNLFLSCQICNQRHKKNLFPLENLSKRARSHRDNISAEVPILIHPTDDDPEAFIAFHEEVPYAIDGNERGTTTIEALGLQRNELAEMGLDFLKRAKLLKQVYVQLERRNERSDRPSTVDEQSMMRTIGKHLEELTRPQAEYSSMMKSLLASLSS